MEGQKQTQPTPEELRQRLIQIREDLFKFNEQIATLKSEVTALAQNWDEFDKEIQQTKSDIDKFQKLPNLT